MYTTADKNYETTPEKIYDKLGEIKRKGRKLDNNYQENMNEMQVLSVGERSGRLLAEVGYPDGTVVLYYKSSKGTSGKRQGAWYPIAGFISDKFARFKKGWFIKDEGVHNRYGSSVFNETCEYLLENEDNLF
jgi:hypothetical protein